MEDTQMNRVLCMVTSWAIGMILLLTVTSSAQGAEVEINVGDSPARVVCSDNDGEMVISKVGKGTVKVTLINGYSWGCRYGGNMVFYDLSMPPVGMVGGVIVAVDVEF